MLFESIKKCKTNVAEFLSTFSERCHFGTCTFWVILAQRKSQESHDKSRKMSPEAHICSQDVFLNAGNDGKNKKKFSIFSRF